MKLLQSFSAHDGAKFIHWKDPLPVGKVIISGESGSGIYSSDGTLRLDSKGRVALVQEHSATAAINATATATAAQVATGYITSTSGSATTITLPTGTLLGSELGAVQGTIHELYIDNTAGSSTVTIATSTNGILSDAAATTAASFGQLTVAFGITGQARFTLMFSSATAFTFTRSG